jgi:hypothetical protein
MWKTKRTNGNQMAPLKQTLENLKGFNRMVAACTPSKVNKSKDGVGFEKSVPF